MISFWIRYIYAPFINRAARRVLTGRLRRQREATKGRFTRQESKEIVRDVWRRFGEFSASVPHEPNLGGRINVRLACLTLCMFQSLLERGVERNYAIELVADITWDLYRFWGKTVNLFVRIRKRNETERLNLAVNSFLKFPFSPPTYQIERIPTADGVNLNVVRCPIAEYFEANNVTDLCSESWCNLDFALAEMWGGSLERTETLALGNDSCNFKFKSGSNNR